MLIWHDTIYTHLQAQREAHHRNGYRRGDVPEWLETARKPYSDNHHDADIVFVYDPTYWNSDIFDNSLNI